jgi:hypothetical protein
MQKFGNHETHGNGTELCECNMEGKWGFAHISCCPDCRGLEMACTGPGSVRRLRVQAMVRREGQVLMPHRQPCRPLLCQQGCAPGQQYPDGVCEADVPWSAGCTSVPNSTDCDWDDRAPDELPPFLQTISLFQIGLCPTQSRKYNTGIRKYNTTPELYRSFLQKRNCLRPLQGATSAATQFLTAT